MFWKRKVQFGDAEKSKFINIVSDMLEVQKALAVGYEIEDAHGKLNRKALGYIYGFVDAALTCAGQDMSDPSLGVPITYQVLRHIFPRREEAYARFLLDNLASDHLLMLGAMKGGQQYADFTKPNHEGCPMGLARYLIEGEEGAGD